MFNVMKHARKASRANSSRRKQRFSTSILNTNIQTQWRPSSVFVHTCIFSTTHRHTTPPIRKVLSSPSAISCLLLFLGLPSELSKWLFQARACPYHVVFHSLKVLKRNMCKKGFSSHGNRTWTLVNAAERGKGTSQSCIPLRLQARGW